MRSIGGSYLACKEMLLGWWPGRLAWLAWPGPKCSVWPVPVNPARIWLGWFGVLLIIFISSMLGSLLGIVGIMTNKVKFKQQLPFGPFIVIATALYYFYKEEILALLLI